MCYLFIVKVISFCSLENSILEVRLRQKTLCCCSSEFGVKKECGMGSVGFDGESESQPSTSNSKKFKLPRKLRDACGAVNHASVPRKLRSAIKKRGRESITPPLPIPTKQNRVANGVERLRKNGAKKSKLNMKPGFITKDEEEVAETLNSLADMFSDANKSNKPMFNGEPSETKSSTKLEEGCSMTAAEDAWTPTLPDERRKSDSRVTLETACHSLNLADSMAQVVKFKSLGDSNQPKLPFSKQPDVHDATGVKSDLCLGPRPKMSILDMIPSEQTFALEQVPPSGVQYCRKDDKNNGSFLWASLSSTGALSSSETQGSCKQIPSWLEKTNCATQRHVIEKCDSYDKSPLSVAEPKKSWKRCSAHVYISRLIKVLQISEKREGSLENPTQLTASGGAELGPHMNIDNQKREIDGTNGVMSSNSNTPYSAAEKNLAEIQNAILLHTSFLQEQQASKTNTLCSMLRQGSDFLSLAAGGCGLVDASDDINRAGHSHNAQKQCPVSYLQPQNHSTMLFSQPQSCYTMFHGRTSAVAAQQVQLPPFRSSNLASSVTDPTGQHWESQQQLWTAPFPSQHYPAGVSTRQPHWQSGERNTSSQLNFTQALFPHLNSALSSKYQQFPQQQLITMNSSMSLTNVKRHTNRLPLGFERNGATCYPDNRSQLQLLCNQQHL